MAGLVLDRADPTAVAVVGAIRGGDLDALGRLLAANPGLATARIRAVREARTLLHVVADWPGHYPNGAATVAALIAAGADVHTRFSGSHAETPLHWAASNDDVAVLDALLDAGADIEADGAVIAGGTPLDDATAFAQWRAAHRLVERGARTSLWHAATLGLQDRVEAYYRGPGPEADRALWGACHGGRRAAAEYLLDRGADVNWLPPWERLTPLDAAVRSGATDLATWLRAHGARSTAA
ncbi:ankyrin repeat domain-containing protein [Dactylosporangium vinaceum]|uniref:Ankyrin repeat domain-containing protein n=1 Tax=Dactylosporangium vinaceum TaxID=53362 RepID=A0ABV5MRI6_9ACTN|nr:ankyrin repeat domain-containing protein [Dactylosporangium vinaceum]UAC00433.1 ankyrin repeat domain-containing protein [Dactylosporangium vinaceum]